MVDRTPQQMPRFKRVARWYGYVSDVLTPARIGLLLGAALLLVISVFGGWDAIDDAVDEVPAAKADETIDVAPFEITVTRAGAFDELEGSFSAQEGLRYIAVFLAVENASKLPVSSYVLSSSTELDLSGLATIDLKEGPQIRDPQLVRIADGLSERTFQPGLPVDIVLVWQQDASEPLPAEIGVSFSKSTWRRSVMDGSFEWRDPVLAAQFTLPLEPVEESR